MYLLRRSSGLAALLAAAVISSACGGSEQPVVAAPATGMAAAAPETARAAGSAAPIGGATTPPATPGAGDLPAADPAAVAGARTLIDGAKLDDPKSLDVLGAARFDDGAPEAAAAALAEGASGDARWAAVWTYASAGTDRDVLRPVLSDPDPTLRALAAAALTAWGDPAGIPVLVDLVGVEERLRGSYPPRTLHAFADGTLVRFVANPPDVPSDATPAERAAAWVSWEGQGGVDRLAFDAETGTWGER